MNTCYLIETQDLISMHCISPKLISRKQTLIKRKQDNQGEHFGKDGPQETMQNLSI